MDAGTYNAGVQFGNYAYNMSGVTTEHSAEIRSNAIQGESHLKNSYDGIEYVSESYDDHFELQDVEIIAIDPNSFYSETTSSSDTSGSDRENDHQELNAISSFDFPNCGMRSFETQPTNDDLDIITLNIDEDFPLDTQEEILFKSDHQFDLASYIGGESNLLMSPMNDISSRRRLMSLSDFGHLESHNLVTATKTANNLSRMPVVQTNTVHDKEVAKTPASNRRKRKNLSREFIETSDSDEDNETKVKSINVVDNSKRNKTMKPRKEDDPMWNPTPDKRTAKLSKLAPVQTKETVESKESAESKKMARNAQPTQGNGLRNLLKQQLLSDRPMNKNKLLKTMSMPSGYPEKSIPPKMLAHPVKRLGVGRGKDIQITAKYYNVNESSDNNERDKIVKQDRFHQIYTDSDTTSQSESESDTESNDSDIEVNSEPSPPKTTIVKQTVSQVVQNDSNKEKSRENIAEKKPDGEPLAKKSNDIKVNANDKRKSMIIESKSLDSTDFAKALVTNAKVVTKTKPNVPKKNNLEQQKRIIQSNILLQNPAKFKLITSNKSKSPLNGIVSSSEVKSGPSIVEQKAAPPKPIQVNSAAATKEISAKSIDSFTNVQAEKVKDQETSCCSRNEQPIKVEHAEKQVNEVQVNQEIQDNVKTDTMSVEENKFETSAKRKLNIQEYLKRKSLKTSPNRDAGVRNGFVNIKAEAIENGTQNEANKNKNTATNDETSPNNSFTGNSMYEEIIIVSMGCSTDISIPASFTQPSEEKSTVLLSDIQTSVEKANAKISCMSLISSIQDVILKKTHSIEQNSKKEATTGDAHASQNNEESPDDEPEHGENKVIMHLRKDRVRPTRVSTSIQTDPYFQFPPLEKLAPLSKKQTMTEKRVGSIPRELHIVQHENKSKTQRHYRGRSHLSESSYYSDDDEDKSIQRRSRHSDFVEHNNGRHRRVRRESSRYSASKYDKYINRHRTISRSLSSSSDNSTTSNNSSSSTQSSTSSSSHVSSTSERSLNSYGGSSSKSYYADDHQYYRKRTTSNNSRRSNYRHSQSQRNRSPEERRIVYVGRIEEEATKEELRRKFSVYGKVKNVSIHYKETKMKYGFVTFVRPCDAYTAIDDSSKNPAICHYDISFGGRRAFCREKYFDLDNTGASKYHDDTITPQKPTKDNDDSFEALLRKVKEKLQEKK